MANELRVYQDFVGGTLDGAITDVATSVNSPAFAALPVIGSTNHIILVFDPDGIDGEPEKVMVTAHTAAAVTCTVVRGYEGSAGGGRAHADDTDWVAPVLSSDIGGMQRGTGSPEGVVTAPVGTLYRRTDGGTGTTLYVKETGTGNTGWVAK